MAAIAADTERETALKADAAGAVAALEQESGQIEERLADAEAIGRLISLALRSGISTEEVVNQLKGIGGAGIK